MWSVMDSVDKDLRVERVRHFGGAAHIADRAESVRCCANCDHLRALGQQSGKIIPIELAGFRNHFNYPQLCTAFSRQPPPGFDIGMMVQLCDQNLVVTRAAAPERAREM